MMSNDMEYLPKVFVILVNWNRIDDTLDCIESLRESTYENFEVIVVDNGSTDGSVRKLRQVTEPLVILEAATNLGFTGGNNLGIRYALAHNADYVFLLNNDTVIEPRAVQELVLAAERDTQVGVVTPKILFFDFPQVIWCAGTEFSEFTFGGGMIGYGLRDKGQFDRRKKIPFASGCAMLIRRSVIQSVGLLDDDFFAVREDLDYSLRVTQAGYSIYYVPSAIVWHKESRSAGGHDAPQYVYYQIRNYVLFVHKWASSEWQKFIAISYAILYSVRRLLILARKGKLRSIIGIVLGIKDGFLKQVGLCEYSVLRNR
jgi:GT2 family glycosyltransferase